MSGLFHSIDAQQIEKGQIDVMLEMSYDLSKLHPDSAYKLAQTGLNESKKLKYRKGQADAHMRLGYIQYVRGQNDAALVNLKSCYRLRMEDKNYAGATGAATMISYVFENKAQKDSAFAILFDCIDIVEKNDSSSLAEVYLSLGNLSVDYGDFKNALKFNLKAESIYETIKDTSSLNMVWGGLGNLYFQVREYDSALFYFEKSDKANRKASDQFAISRNLNNIALCYDGLERYGLAIAYFSEAIAMHRELDMQNDLALALSNLGLTFYHDKQLDSAIFYYQKSLDLARQLGYMSIVLTDLEFLAMAYSSAGDYRQAYDYQIMLAALNDSLLNEEKIKQISEMQVKYESEKKEQQIQLLDTKNKSSSAQRNLFIVATILGLLLALTLLFAWKRTSKEKNRSDELLLNILPSEVANELMTTGKNEAKLYQHVTVLFTDFVGFTRISQNMSPQELVQEIHKHFTAFDQIMERHGLEKIKTIGDAYLAVCGLPTETPYHAQRVILAALDIIHYLKSHENSFEIRIGVNSGPVVAGIVGIKKFAYDIWGDTVNTAARMEQHSEPNRINISQSTFALVSADFECTYRGQINAKNKGEISMYFVEGKKDGPILGF